MYEEQHRLFQTLSIAKSDFVFTCGGNILLNTEKLKYVYLGLTLTEQLVINITANVVGQSAGCALDLLIAKYKSFGWIPYNVLTKLFDFHVWNVVSYGASIYRE